MNGQWAIYEPYFEKVARSDSDLAAVRIEPDPRFTDNSGALNLFGGYWHQNAGDPHVWTGEGVSGNLIGGEYASVPGDNKDIYPKHHIRNKSPRFSILWPTLINDTREELIKSAGPVRATNIRPGAGTITSRNSPQDLSGMTGLYDGEQLVDDGSNTAARGVTCTWDDINGVWRRPDGSSFQPTVGIDADVVIPRFTPDAIDGQRGNLDDIDPALSVDEDFSVFRNDPSIDGANSNIWLTWDDEAFYWYGELADPEHFNDNPWDSLFRGDSIQIGISKGEPGEADQWLEFDFGLTDSGPLGAVRRYPDVEWSEVDGTDIPFDIVRDESAGVTSYQIKFPWSEIDPSSTDDILSTAAAIIDVDADGNEEGLLEWAGGIFGGKDNGAYAVGRLVS